MTIADLIKSHKNLITCYLIPVIPEPVLFDLKVRDDTVVIQLLAIWTLLINLFFYLKRRFRGWSLPPSSVKLPTQAQGD
jgi:hypothetical protein